jgi:hypothetical protein
MTLYSITQTILDETGGATFWTADHVYDALNSVLVDFWDTGGLETSATLTVPANDPSIVIPSTVMIPKYILGTNGKVFLTTTAKLEQYDRGWRTAQTGYPKHFVLTDASTLRPYPLADTEYELTLYGTPWPTEIAAGTLDITADEGLKLAIAHQAAGELMSLTQPPFAEESYKEAARLLSQYKIHLRNQQSHRLRTLRPATTFTAAQGGAVRIGRRLA